MAELTVATPGSDIPQNQTIYINNLKEKIKLEEFKKSVNAVFSQFGKIAEVIAFKTLKHKGQPWVVFDDVSSAASALRQMQGFPLYDKPMNTVRKSKSDVIAKADGTFVPREKRKKHDDRERKKKEQHDANQAGIRFQSCICRSLWCVTSSIPYVAGVKAAVPEAPAPPNNILFVQNLPHRTTPMMLQVLFCQYYGFKQVRTVEAKHGIAFVEY